MVWLRKVPKRPSSVKSALIEIRKAVISLKAKRKEVFNNEVSLEYPREKRVNVYKKQLESIDNILNFINQAIAELERCSTEGMDLS